MKSRIFLSAEAEFKWSYDADTQKGEGIAEWYRAWQSNGGKKIPLPGGKK